VHIESGRGERERRESNSRGAPRFLKNYFMLFLSVMEEEESGSGQRIIY